MNLSRRDVLRLGGAALAGASLAPSIARAQTPKRGGTLSIRTWDPPHFDPFQTISYKTHIALSFTHSRLLKHKSGPSVVPGTFPIEGDLAESWTQPNETTYVFKLRRGVKWHNKPPVNGRELTADDVVFSVNHFLTVKGNANAYMLKAVDKVEATDKYTVKFTLKEPFVWFLDMISNPHAVAIVAKEVLDKHGDFKKWESVVGTGPWMLDSYRPNVGLTVVFYKAIGEDKKLLRVVVPLGVLLPTGLGLKIDGQDVGNAPFLKCGKRGCVAEVVLQDEVIAKMKTGTTAMFIIFDTPEAGIGIPVALQGFGDALANLK